MFKKNDVCILEIDDIGTNGEGIGKVDGYTLFIKDALPGDRVEAKIMKANKNFGYARVQKILASSPDRVEPVCPVASKCGGCQLQHLSYEKQLEFKENKVKNNLERIGKAKDFVMHPIIGMDNPYHYRNKAQYPVRMGNDGNIHMGFYAGRTHSVIETEKCYIDTEGNDEILKLIKENMIANNVSCYDEEKHKGLVRHILIRKGFATSEIMVCIVINGKTYPAAESLVTALTKIPGMTSVCLNVNREKGNVILGKEIINLYGKGYITDTIGDVKFQISPLAFYQVNPAQTVKLYETALKYAGLTGKETVWDLYCGIGTISLFLAKSALHVKGVEIISEAIENARNNAKLNHIDNAEFYVGKAEEVLPKYYDEQRAAGNNATADVIVVDPPRKGCDIKLRETMVKMSPERIVYVSCDSATLARDVEYFTANGYKLVEVQTVDMFGMGVHVETVVLLGRKFTEDIEYGYVDYEPSDDIVIKGSATYSEIKQWILDNYGMKVSSLYVAQVKDKLGFEKRDNYNIGADGHRVPVCPKEKEEAIIAAFKHFKMI